MTTSLVSVEPVPFQEGGRLRKQFTRASERGWISKSTPKSTLVLTKVNYKDNIADVRGTVGEKRRGIVLCTDRMVSTVTKAIRAERDTD